MVLGVPLYNIKEDLPANKNHLFDIPPIKLPESPRQANVFGKKINSPLGVPASPLTMTPNRIAVLAALGYDLITFKSARSHEHKGNDYPHWVYVDAPDEIDESNFNDELVGAFDPFPKQEVSTANSFGVASDDPQLWIAEFEKSKSLVSEGQALVLSVMPSTLRSETMLEDIRMLAAQIAMTTAEVIELNLACPNTGGHGLIYQDLELSTKLLKELQRLLPGRKIVAKIGYYENQRELDVFLQLNQDLAGIASMNTVAMRIVDQNGNLIFGSGRPKAGVSGATIRSLGIKQAGNLVNSRNKLGLEGSMSIIGIGGVTKPEHIDQYLNLGVDAVQSAVGVWANSNLAVDYRNLHSQEA